MADQDDDWQKFLKSTEEDPEEVETDDELEDEEIEDDEGDDEGKKSKKSDQGDAKKSKSKENPEEGAPKTGDDDKEDDDSEDDEEEEDQPKSRVKQFLNDDGKFDLKRAEKAYIDSSKEAVRLNGELEKSNEGYTKLLDALAANPKAAEALFGKDGAKQFLESRGSATKTDASGTASAPADPVVQHIKAKMDNDSRKEYQEFVDAHPEAVTDPEKRQKIGEFLKLHGAVYREQHKGEIPSMKESLEAAYAYHGWDLGTSKKEDVAIAAKKTAASRTTPNAKRPAKKKDTSYGEDYFAKKLGVKLK